MNALFAHIPGVQYAAPERRVHPRYVDAEKRARIVELRKEGRLTHREIAERVDTSITTVGNVLRAEGFTGYAAGARGSGIPLAPEVREMALRLAETLSDVDVAAALGIHSSTVWGLRKNAGIPSRRRGNYTRAERAARVTNNPEMEVAA